MKISIEGEGHSSIVTTNEEHIDEVLNYIIQALLGYGFQSESINSAICGKAEEYEEIHDKTTE